MSSLKISSAVLITLGSLISYVPQIHKIVINKSVDGISQISLVLTNMGMFCLTMNSLIFTWTSIINHHWIEILPFVQIASSWLMVLIYYIIFLLYNFKKQKKRFIYGLHYLTTYILFVIFLISLTIGEYESVKNQDNFFDIFARALGYCSAIINSVVYIPQIIEIYRKKSVGSNSFVMYFMQTPGNAIIILFQAVVYNGHISTWITYVIVFIQQTIVLLLMTYYHYSPVDKSFPIIQESWHISDDELLV